MKKWLWIASGIAVMGLLLWQGQVTSSGVRQGLILCSQSVIPALFPFMVAVRFLIVLGLGQWFAPTVTAFAVGAAGGYPLGAATVGQLYHTGQISRTQANRLLCCCNNAGPAFILNFLGRGIFGSLRVGLFLWGIHLCSALLSALLFFPREHSATPSCAVRRPFAASLVTAVTDSVDTMARVCGFVILFSVITALAVRFGLTSPLLLGALELTCGAGSLPHSAKGFVTAAALLGWGGVSVHCQTAAVLSGTDLSLGQYVAAKAMQGGISAIFAWAVGTMLF